MFDYAVSMGLWIMIVAGFAIRETLDAKVVINAARLSTRNAYLVG